ncbi:MAG: 3-oxoacyl-ACP reductase FabG [Rickettsiaceae bacterium]|nr:3-oxoacyl-ACP reductase FabG [Rickettsiaceae bacterium]
MIDLSGSNALITGASGDIGKAITKQFHKLGAHVYISGSNLEKLQALADELGDNCTIKQCNLSDAFACSTLLDDIEKLDILVCNAGITKDGLSIKMSEDNFDEVINVNLKANFILNQAAIKKMMRARYGRIINMSSVVAVAGNPGQSNYCASKAGLIGMSKSLALEVATRGITINVVAPGFIESNMTNALNEAQKEVIMQKVPLKSFGKPEDIANAVTFLASPLSSYITGQTIHVNGGMLLV